MTSMYFLIDCTTGRCLQKFNAVNTIEANTVCAVNQIAVLVPEGISDSNVYFSGKVFHNIPEMPSLNHTFNWQTKQWEDPRTLQDLKDAQWTAVKQARSQAEYAGFTWDGSTFDSDATSQQRITGAVTLAQMTSEFTINWTLQDNSVRTLNQLDMLNVGMELGFHVAAQFTKAQVLRTQIEAATTPAEVAALVWQCLTR